MPPQTSKTANPILGALRQSATAKVDYGQDYASLPGGISGGIAELTKCELGTFKKGDNAGKRYFMAMATVLRPEVAVDTIKKFDKGKVQIVSQQEVQVKGRQTKIGPMPMCETKTKGTPPKVTTLQENVAAVVNELKKLGGEECTHTLAQLPDNATEKQCFDAIQAICDALVAASPPIQTKFRTWQGDPSAAYPTNSRVNEYWMGAVGSEAMVSSNPAAGVEDDSGSGPSANGHAESEAQPESAPAEPDSTEEQTEDIAQLAVDADAGDKAAQARLTELAIEAGYDKDAVENAEPWAALLDMINNPVSGEEAVEEEPAAAWAPAEGEEYDYYPIVKNAKTGKVGPSAKAVKCDVVAVDEGSQTVTLQARDKAKTQYKKVPWAKIEPK